MKNAAVWTKTPTNEEYAARQAATTGWLLCMDCAAPSQEYNKYEYRGGFDRHCGKLCANLP